MKKSLGLYALLAIAIAVCVGAVDQPKKIYPDRWVYISKSFQSDKDVEDVREIARTASEHGLNGIVLAGMDRISLYTPEELARLNKVKEIADSYHLEIVPEGFNTGYGGAILAHDKNLAEGLLVKDALFVAKGGSAQFVADSPAKLVNGGFEEYQGNSFTGFTTQTDPGVKTFVDTSVYHSGKASLRIENFAQPPTPTPAPAAAGAPSVVAGAENRRPRSAAYVSEEISVTPYRCYRVSAWVKTEDAEPASLFSIRSSTPDGRNLSPFESPAPAPTSGWREVTTAFNSWYADRINLTFGVFGGRKGKVWVDDVRVEEVGLMNVIRRDGATLTVRDEKTGKVYKEGRDFAAISDPNLDFYWTHPMPVIHLLTGGHIHDGARLRVSYYHGTTIYNDQTPACPSTREVRKIWKEQFPLIQKYLMPKRYFIGVDEVRAIDRDESCLRRKMTPAAILGDTTQWLYDQVHAVNPKAQVLVWSDMFDPNHNSVKQYFLVDGSVENTWNYLPKDMGIICWNFRKRQQSLDFFSSRGFKTYVAAYYDAKDLEHTETNAKGWMDAMDTTPGAMGIMYTTWDNNYQFLAPFGDMVSKRP
ncbi:MAG: hypothetical protein ACLQLH_02250 [Terracidiphilus sp.]